MCLVNHQFAQGRWFPPEICPAKRTSVDHLRWAVNALWLKAGCKIGKYLAVEPVLIKGARRRRRVDRAVISSRFPLQLEFSDNAVILVKNDDCPIFLSGRPGPKGNAPSGQLCALSKDSIFHRRS